MANPSKPNLSSSQWRTVWNQKDKVLFFDFATRPTIFWVPFSDLDFSADAEVKKLPMTGGQIYAGNAASKFEPAAPFEFMPAKAHHPGLYPGFESRQGAGNPAFCCGVLGGCFFLVFNKACVPL
jgi:hypothetical protein